jgi:hypothetical protein
MSVAHGVERREHIAGKLASLIENRGNQFRIIGFKALKAFKLADTRDAGQAEGDIFKGRIIGH